MRKYVGERQLVFSGINNIIVKSGRCDIDIVPFEDERCCVDIDGKKSSIDKISIIDLKGNLCIDTLLVESKVHISIKVKALQSLALHDNRDNTVNVCLMIPYIKVNTLGASVFNFKSIGDGEILLNGSSVIFIENVLNGISSSINGSGSIMIEGGNPSYFNVTIGGSGEFKSNAAVSNADLTLLGSGKIILSNVKNELIKKCVGTGNIIIND